MSVQREIKLGLRNYDGVCNHRLCETLLHRLCARGVISADDVRRAIMTGTKTAELHDIFHSHPVEFNEEVKRVRAKFRLLGEEI
jgi:hypothetical protein